MTTNPSSPRLPPGSLAVPSGTTVNGDMVKVSVIYARPEGCWQVALAVPAGTVVEDVIRLSGIEKAFPQFAGASPPVGIFGRRCRPDEVVSEGDRIEIYRPLTFDPMESRRRRAAHRKAAAKKAAFRPRRVRDGKSS